MIDSTILLQVLWTSFASASYQALFTVAFALVLKVSRIWNFTQPALMGVAFYSLYVAHNALALPLWAAVAATLPVTCGLAWATDRLAFRTLRARASEPIAFFIFTLVFAQFTVFLLTLVFTAEPVFLLPDMMWPLSIVGGVVVSAWDLWSIAIAAALTAALWAFLRLTRQGQFMIAVADNADLAEIYGIDKERCFALSMLIAGALIVAAMYVFGTRLAAHPELMLHIMIFAVAATILGGIGNVFGAAAAAVGISVLQQLSVLVVDSRWQSLVVFAILFLAIIFFPTGLALPGRRSRRLADGRGGTPGPGEPDEAPAPPAPAPR